MTTFPRQRVSQVRILPGAQNRWSKRISINGVRTAEARSSINCPDSPSDTLGLGRTRLHTFDATCWCEPPSAFDGHCNADGTDPDFQGMAGDPIDAAGFALEGPR